MNEMAEGYTYYDFGGVSISPDNRYAVMGIDTLSRRNYTLMIKDLETGNMLNDIIPMTTGGASWANDNSTIFIQEKMRRPLEAWPYSGTAWELILPGMSGYSRRKMSYSAPMCTSQNPKSLCYWELQRPSPVIPRILPANVPQRGIQSSSAQGTRTGV